MTESASPQPSQGVDHTSALVTRLATMLRNAHVHVPTSDTWPPLLKALNAAVYGVLKTDSDSLTLSIEQGQVTVNQTPVRPGFGEYNAFNYLVQDLSRLHVGGIRFRPPMNDVQTKKFVYAIAELSGREHVSFEDLDEHLRSQGVRSIELVRSATSEDVQRTTGDHRQRATEVFLSGIDAVAGVMERVREGKTVGLRRCKRFVEAATDLLNLDPSLALSLTTIKNYRDYLYTHSVNVSLISLLVGAKLGFERRRLADLGLAALLREVGKASLPPELLEKKGEFSKEDWDQLKLFPYAAVTGLLRFRGFNERTVRQVLVAFEHQFHSAENKTVSDREFTLFSRIAHLAAAYDAMTTQRPYRARPFTPDEALQELIRDRVKHQVDALLLKAFVHAMGLYPVGTAVLLDTGDIGVVCDPPFDAESLARPRVRLIANAENQEYLAPTRVETRAVDADGNYLRTIVRTLDAWRYGINVPRHVLDLDTETVLQ